MQTRGSKFLRFQELKLQELVGTSLLYYTTQNGDYTNCLYVDRPSANGPYSALNDRPCL
jgi:hypothetical protein